MDDDPKAPLQTIPEEQQPATSDRQSEDRITERIADSASIVSVQCRICYDDDKNESVISPCLCKGTTGYVHRSCLEQWLGGSNSNACELCHAVYHTERSPRYTAGTSIRRWLHHKPQDLGFQVRGLRGDIIACSVLTPLAIIITYVCLFSADYYSQKKFSDVPAARWTSVSLLIMIMIMILGYYMWIYMVIRYHGRLWYYWWQRDSVVVLIDNPSLNSANNNNTTNTTNTNTTNTTTNNNNNNNNSNNNNSNPVQV